MTVMTERWDPAIYALIQEGIRLGLTVDQAERAAFYKWLAIRNCERPTREGLEPLPPWAEGEARE
jgi:hypothetical protein